MLLNHDNGDDIDEDSVRDLLEDIYNLDTDGNPFINRVGLAFTSLEAITSLEEAALVEAVDTGCTQFGCTPQVAAEMKNIVEKK